MDERKRLGPRPEPGDGGTTRAVPLFQAQPIRSPEADSRRGLESAVTRRYPEQPLAPARPRASGLWTVVQWSPGQPSTSGSAAELLAGGAYPEALAAYRSLARAHPEQRVYGVIADLIEEHLDARSRRSR